MSTALNTRGEGLLVDRITVKYGDYTAIEDISLKVESGHTTAVIGPSGCGKTTTLKAVAGLNHVHVGSIMLGGRDITEVSPAKRNIGLVPQSYAVFPHMSVGSNIAYGLKARGIDVVKQNQVVHQILEMTQLTEYANRKPDQLSGGQRQRVALGRALAIEPEVLLLDEPLAALDPQLRGELRRQLAAMLSTAGCGTLIVTHDQHEALALADRIAILEAGRVVQYGTPEDLWERPINAFVADFLTNSLLLDARIEGDTVSALDGQWTTPLSALEKVVDEQRAQPQLLVRPTSLQIAPESEEHVLVAAVDSVEYSGGKLQAVVIGPGDTNMLLTTEDMIEAGQTLRLRIAPGQATLIGG